MSSSAEQLRPEWVRSLLTASRFVAMGVGVVALCASIAGIAYASWPSATPTRRTQTKTTMLTVQQSLVLFQSTHDEDCPATLAEFTKTDAWQTPLRFVCPGVHTPDGADVVSAGPDGQFDTQDDIKSWEL